MVFKTRVAWPLAETGELAGIADFTHAAKRFGRFALSRQRDNGWFEQCCLTDATRPLTHTLAYAARGFLELGLALGEKRFVNAALGAARGLAQCVGKDGFLPGRLDDDWRPAARWCCLTGAAQTAMIFWRLNQEKLSSEGLEAARLINKYLMQRHAIFDPDPRIRGGVYGSWPIYGPYGKFEVLNWATKFFVDSLMAELHFSRT